MYKLLPIRIKRALTPPDPLRPEPDSVDESAVTDQVIFSALYDQYAPVLLGIITKMIPDETESMGVLEKTFLTIHSRIDQFQPHRQPLFTWLLHITRQTANDALDKRRPIKPANRELSETGKAISDNRQKGVSGNPFFNPSNSTENLQKDLLDSILFKNCTPAEAAHSLNIPVEQAQQQLRLAVQKLLRRTGA